MSGEETELLSRQVDTSTLAAMSNTGLYESDSEPEGSRYADSDEESLVDVDSPADGYFERREHPQTTYIPNPATQSRSEEDKAQEAATERRERERREAGASSGERERERPPSHHSHPRSPVWTADESTPLLDAGPAGPPPDYAAATADRRGHGREGSYGSVSESAFSSDHPLVRNGLLNEQGVFGQRSDPQSMRDSPTSPSSPLGGERGGLRGGGGPEGGEGVEEGDEERGFVRRQWDRDWNGQRRWARHFPAKRVLRWLTVVLVLGIIVSLSGIFEDAQDNGKYPSGGNGRNTPETTPDGGDDDDGSDKNPMPPHQSTPQCQYHTFSTPERHAFNPPANFTLLEFIDDPVERAFFNDHVAGTIQLSAAPASQKDAIVVWIGVALSGSMEINRLRMVHDEEALQILFPDVSGNVKDLGASGSHRWAGDEDNCLDFSVGVSIRPGTKLDGLEIGTANMDVLVEHGVFDKVVDSDGQEDDAVETQSYGPVLEHLDVASITTVRGKVHADYLSSRTTYIETTSSSISGTYALRDLLSVKSTSGSISIAVDPQNASPEDPDHPADFHAASNSGSINVDIPTDSFDADALPDRDYRTRVEAHSSSIKGNYILGSSARFETNSGGLDLRILPFSTAEASTLRTSSGSGHTTLELLSPYTAAEALTGRPGVLDHVTSSHKSHSGSLHLTYPDEWEGVVDGESSSGSIRVRGEDVEILLDEDFGRGIPRAGRGAKALKHVTARKGYGESRLGFSTTSGSVDVLVGYA